MWWRMRMAMIRQRGEAVASPLNAAAFFQGATAPLHRSFARPWIHGAVCCTELKQQLVARPAAIQPSKSGQQLEQEDEDPPPAGCSRIKVELRKPLGLKLREEASSGKIFIAEVFKNGSADRSGIVDVGDELIATSAVVYTEEEVYQGVNVRKGMKVVRLNVRGEAFDTVVAAIGTHPGYMNVTLELQKCKPALASGNGAAGARTDPKPIEQAALTNLE